MVLDRDRAIIDTGSPANGLSPMLGVHDEGPGTASPWQQALRAWLAPVPSFGTDGATDHCPHSRCARFPGLPFTHGYPIPQDERLREERPPCRAQGGEVEADQDREGGYWQRQDEVDDALACTSDSDDALTARGRPALERGVVSFEAIAEVPDAVVLDTCFVVAVLVPTEDHHGACAEFMERMVEHGTALYYNRVLEVELAETAFKIAIKKQHGSRAWPRKHADGRVRRRASRLAKRLVEEWEELLSVNPSACIELHEVSDNVLLVMTDAALHSMDAVHAATAIYVDAPLVTIDAGFGYVPEKDLKLLVDASRVRSTRTRRGGAR
ncbi:type II toxin-antitoxin system VapC family toxin [Agrococcus sp. 1P02AA]|uniref:type II toxin-antitoxin system VapC family toxin n=1 Tax=Agrococcus sp. 1P02AA TaxID=3132259 RepID=UPI0039A40A44